MRFYKNPLRLLDCKNPQDQSKIQAAPRITDYLCEPCREHFAAVQQFLELDEVPFSIDPLIVRGLDYYTRTVFEFTSEVDKLALNGGGRYDGLAELLGGPPTPGIGFGAGIERIIAELKKQHIAVPTEEKPRAFVVYIGKTKELKASAVQLTAQLRKAGIKVEMSYGDRSPKAQMKQANNSGATYALIIGDNELANSSVSIKDLQADTSASDKKQIEVKRAQVIDFLSGAHVASPSW